MFYGLWLPSHPYQYYNPYHNPSAKKSFLLQLTMFQSNYRIRKITLPNSHTFFFTADTYPPLTTIKMVSLHVLWIMIAIASISILQSLPQPSAQKFFLLQLTLFQSNYRIRKITTPDLTHFLKTYNCFILNLFKITRGAVVY